MATTTPSLTAMATTVPSPVLPPSSSSVVASAPWACPIVAASAIGLLLTPALLDSCAHAFLFLVRLRFCSSPSRLCVAPLFPLCYSHHSPASLFHAADLLFVRQLLLVASAPRCHTLLRRVAPHLHIAPLSLLLASLASVLLAVLVRLGPQPSVAPAHPCHIAVRLPPPLPPSSFNPPSSSCNAHLPPSLLSASPLFSTSSRSSLSSPCPILSLSLLYSQLSFPRSLVLTLPLFLPPYFSFLPPSPLPHAIAHSSLPPFFSIHASPRPRSCHLCHTPPSLPPAEPPNPHHFFLL